MIQRLFISALAGGIFGLGLAIAQMTDPQKVQAFLDIRGDWDPSLAFVMGGAVTVALIGFKWARSQGKPFCDSRFHLPDNVHVDKRLVTGAAVFGVGWGLTGYCPGPAIATLLTSNHEVWIFVPAMLLGGWLQRRWQRR